MTCAQPGLIAAVDLNRRAAGVIRRAARLAQVSGLSLIVVHVVEHENDSESDHAPVTTPTLLRIALARDARAWLGDLLHHMNLPQAKMVVLPGRPAAVLVELVEQHRVRYVVTGPLKRGGLSRLANLAADPRLLEARCAVLHPGNEDNWSVRLWRWAGRCLLGQRPHLPE